MNVKWHLSAEHKHLLRATLCTGAAAQDAWQLWSTTVDFENDLDLASYRLLPMLYYNLQASQIDVQLLPRLRGVYKRTWVENQLLFKKLEATVAEIDVVWLGEGFYP